MMYILNQTQCSHQMLLCVLPLSQRIHTSDHTANRYKSFQASVLDDSHWLWIAQALEPHINMTMSDQVHNIKHGSKPPYYIPLL